MSPTAVNLLITAIICIAVIICVAILADNGAFNLIVLEGRD
jgi:hypothetical protein